ncbi:hypothetical protein EYC98_15545 [Halieaceae bacterium IMCC14734]|uniref:Uncharacterized protein n=1 Tax=Candidatus Litorirhabdus singularis TaxID=2518993 RepID=A0ABT3TKH3_9GAMM|nr:hypothetical protein [Candidatus Litorirhabdus singularis]MCX2982276.1 hypothetical protein [Candidatus Litorirhabdus singularis]
MISFRRIAAGLSTAMVPSLAQAHHGEGIDPLYSVAAVVGAIMIAAVWRSLFEAGMAPLAAGDHEG